MTGWSIPYAGAGVSSWCAGEGAVIAASGRGAGMLATCGPPWDERLFGNHVGCVGRARLVASSVRDAGTPWVFMLFGGRRAHERRLDGDTCGLIRGRRGLRQDCPTAATLSTTGVLDGELGARRSGTRPQDQAPWTNARWTNARSISSSLEPDRRARRSPIASQRTAVFTFCCWRLEARHIRCRRYRSASRASSIGPA